MIRMKFCLGNVDNVPATLTMTMTIGEWKALQVQLEKAYPSYQFELAIQHLVRETSKTLSEEIDT